MARMPSSVAAAQWKSTPGAERPGSRPGLATSWAMSSSYCSGVQPLPSNIRAMAMAFSSHILLTYSEVECSRNTLRLGVLSRGATNGDDGQCDPGLAGVAARVVDVGDH